MLAEGVTPDFIIVDGAEGGTGAAPLEYEDHVGTPLTEGLMTVHNALVGAGLRDRIRIGASGKVATGIDIVKRLVQGADYTNAARAMMMAVGCIQAQTLPHQPAARSGSPPRTRGAPARWTCRQDRAGRTATSRRPSQQAQQHDGLDGRCTARPSSRPHHAACAGSTTSTDAVYAELYDWLEPGQLLAEPPEALGRATGPPPTPTRFAARQRLRAEHHDHRRRD